MQRDLSIIDFVHIFVSQKFGKLYHSIHPSIHSFSLKMGGGEIVKTF